MVGRPDIADPTYGFISYWKINEISGNTAADSFSGYTGTLHYVREGYRLFNNLSIKYKRNKIERKQSDCRKATLKLYAVYRKHYQHLLDLDVRKIQKGDIEKYLLSELPSELSQKYTRNMLLALKTFFRWLNDQEKIEIPKFPDFKVTVSEKQRSITYEAQMEAIGNFPEQHRDILYFQRETGLRVSEVCTLEIGDFDFHSSRVLIQRTYSGYDLIETTKGNKGGLDPCLPIRP